MTESKESDLIKDGKINPLSELMKKIMAAANYCYNCNRCVNVCPKSVLNVFFPRQLIVDLNYLPLEEALENNNIWECLSCSECME